jgi:restriction system protein
VAEITRTRTGELVQGVLRILSGCPDGLPASEVLARLAEDVPPTAFEATDYPDRPGDRRYEKIVRFMTINAVKAGWLVKDKGTWSITDEGRRALAAFPDPTELMHESVRLYRAWKQGQPASAEPVADVEDVPDVVEQRWTSLEVAVESAWREITEYVRTLTPYEFQDLIAGLLRAMGYHVTWVAPPGPDRGIDIVAATDPLGASGPRVKVQVKHRADKTTVESVRAFMAVLGTHDVGIFVSSGGFTSEAERETRSQETRRLSLIGLSELFDLWVEHYDRLNEDTRQLLPLKPVYFLALRP